MRKNSKRYQDARKVADLDKTFESLEEAVDVLLQMPKAKFDETVEVSARLGVDPRQSDQMVRGTVSLPNGSGKKVVVAVFTDKPDEALSAGADFAGLADLIQKVQDGWMEFDVALATTEAMKEVRKIARVLGPRGLMPNPKSGTVTDNVVEGINAVKAGRVEYKLDKTGNIAVVVGKRSFSKEQLTENARTAIESIVRAKPDTYKGGRYIATLTVSSTMSPGVRVEPKTFAA